MSYQVIARKWRPQVFEEVTGQEHITQTLRNALEFDRVHHAYLFSGARGVGKTTTARLLAKALNCHKTKDMPSLRPCSTSEPDACPSCIEISESRSMDVLEIDAASHTGIDDVRDTIIENINVNPARDRCKVFIIDEVHQLSKPAFNALLKTLEEPPLNVVFIMATTELHKVPETITSRCQEFQFRTISQQKIFERLKLIATAEGIQVDDAALREIARSGEGSMRDAQSNFDQVISFSGKAIRTEDVSRALGFAGVDTLVRVVASIIAREPAAALAVVDELVTKGNDLRSFCRDLLALFRDLMVYKVAGASAKLLDGSMLPAERLKELSAPFGGSDLLRLFNSLAMTESGLKDANQPRYALELGLVKLIEMRHLAPLEDLIERVAQIEAAIENRVQAGSEMLPETGSAARKEGPEKKTLIPESAPVRPAGTDLGTDGSAAVPDTDETASRTPPDFAATRFDRIAFSPGDIPSKLPPLSSDDLEHIPDDALDTAFEERLERLGDDLGPIQNVEKLVRPMLAANAPGVPSSSVSTGHASAAVAPAREISAFAPPKFETEEADAPAIELPENPTPEQLVAYARSLPAVRRVTRIFRAEIVEVKRT